MRNVKWTYDRIQDYVEEEREKAGREGCKECGKVASLLLLGSPPLSRMIRAGRKIEDIQEAIKNRGWYCRRCAAGYKKAGQKEKLRVWGKEQQQQQQQSKSDTGDAQRAACREFLDKVRRKDLPPAATGEWNNLIDRMMEAQKSGFPELEEALDAILLGWMPEDS